MGRQGKKKRSRLCLLCFLGILFLMAGFDSYAKEDPVNEAKKSIVEIYSGFTTNDESFHKLKHASGFVIGNESDRAYVITTYDTLKSSEKKKKKYCKKKNISVENQTLNDDILVVVKGDVTARAEIVTASEKENYAILQVDGGISERIPVKLDTTENVVTGDTVYALGFAEDAGENDESTDRHTEFTDMDVEIIEGKIQDSRSNQGGILYLQHSAKISEGNTGGPLLNEDGYVIGVNTASLNEEGRSIFYSLPMDGIQEILDNFQVIYESKSSDEIIQQYRLLLEECKSLAVNKTYKSKSKEKLSEVLQSVEAIDVNDMGKEQMKEKIQLLEDAKEELQLKMSVTRKLIFFLAFVIVVLLFWLIGLLIWKINWKRRVKSIPNTEGEWGKIEENSKRNQFHTTRKKKEENESGNITSVDDEEGTRILNSPLEHVSGNYGSAAFQSRKRKASIKCIRTGQNILLQKPEIFLGKKQEGNDIVFSDNKAVSRQHACVFWEQEQYYLMDLGSSNGTFLNGKKIAEREKTLLKDKDNIMLADEKLIFQMERES